MLQSKETLEDKNDSEPLQKPKRERTPAQQEATQKMLIKRKEAVDTKRELVAPLVQQIETIKKTKGKDVVKINKPKPVVEVKLPLVEESESESEDEVIVIKKKPKVAKKKKVIYVEDDSEDEPEQPCLRYKTRIKPEIIKPINPYTIRFV